MLDVVIVGAGPASIGLVSCLFQNNNDGLQNPLKICVIDRGNSKDFGRLANYDIPSDTRAEKFLTCLDGLPASVTDTAQLKALTKVLQSYKSKPAPLPIVGEFYRHLGHNIFENMAAKKQLELSPMTNVVSAERRDEYWHITTQGKDTQEVVQAKNLVLACGATEPQERFDRFLSSIGLHVDDLGLWCLSSQVLKASQDAEIFEKLKHIKPPKIAIIGGSHSAISSAGKLLTQNIPFADHGITIFHRSPMHVTFDSVQEAYDNGFDDFGDEDICPRTQRVFALKGFRLDSRDLLMRIKGYGNHSAESRVKLTSIQSIHNRHIKRSLQEADLVISALGYEPEYVPLYQSSTSNPIVLNAPNFVDDKSRLLDSASTVIPNAYALGLASNYNLAGRFGEPSFTGQANGLVLWHKDIGMDIASPLMEDLR